MREQASTPATARKPHAAVVYNPIKVDGEKLRTAVNRAAAAANWATTAWFETTEQDAGQNATASALRRGASMLIVAGGDGTVRAVAEGLRGSEVPLAIVPSGTGNLLARNLDLTVSNLDESVDNAFNGIDKAIDLGVVEIVRASGDSHSTENAGPEEHVFLVMAGIGLDAKMIKNTNTKLKKAVGWLAYVEGITRSLPELSPVRLRYRLDHAPERALTAHTVLIGNCGLLPGGILLMPEAKLDDGVLDIAALRPRGPFGWVNVWNKVAWENGVLRKSALGRRIIDLSKDVRDVKYLTGKELRMTLESPEEFQLDGDEFGEAISVLAWVEPSALKVRMPAPRQP
jgi:diacylglycerol kinase (ATP)